MWTYEEFSALENILTFVKICKSIEFLELSIHFSENTSLGNDAERVIEQFNIPGLTELQYLKIQINSCEIDNNKLLINIANMLRDSEKIQKIILDFLPFENSSQQEKNLVETDSFI